MGIRIKYDIGTAVSVGIVIGKNEDGSDREQEVVFLPGAVLPPNIAPRLVKGLKSGDPHLSGLMEFDGQAERDEMPHQLAVIDENPVNPFTAVETPEVTADTDYTEWKRGDLDKELAARTEAGRVIEVTGTGTNGNVVASDIAAALKADDEAQGAANG